MQYDVVVVGAGPAGATAARLLAKSGLQVVLVEEDNTPQEKPCGGMLTPRVFERFEYLGNKTEKMEISPSYGTRLYPPSSTTSVPYFTDKPQVLMILRRKFDHTLVQMAMDSGAELITGRVKGVTVKPDTAKTVLNDNSVINSHIVIGADGVDSTVAQETGLTPTLNRRKVALCAVSELEIGENTVEEYFGNRRPIHLFLGFDNLFGYAWVFPKRKHVNIGLGGVLSKTRNLPRSFQKFLTLLKKKELIPQQLLTNDYSVALIPTGGPIEQTFRDRVLLCGDAAGFVNPLTGEGIYYAMASGEMASQVITQAIERGKPTSQQLSTYQAAWMKDFGKNLKKAANFQNTPMKTAQMLEIGAKLAKTDKKLTKMLAELCLNRKPLTKTSLAELLLRLPISTGKHFYKQLLKNRES